uniref:Sel1 repeat family protein n=1 Tax=Strombidinopsis acuminata TaxID=141414 RepID=A0A7S3X0Y0_9SPIT
MTGAAWVSTAANQGYGEAEFEMGMMLAQGIGVQLNFEWARYWLEKAAGQRSCRSAGNAAYRIGQMYAFGEGVEISSEKALFWFERSAERGHNMGMSEAQTILRKGVGQVTPARGNTPGLPAAIRKRMYGSRW